MPAFSERCPFKADMTSQGNTHCPVSHNGRSLRNQSLGSALADQWFLRWSFVYWKPIASLWISGSMPTSDLSTVRCNSEGNAAWWRHPNKTTCLVRVCMREWQKGEQVYRQVIDMLFVQIESFSRTKFTIRPSLMELSFRLVIFGDHPGY